MRRLRMWVVRLMGVFGARSREREFARELESHLQLHTDDAIRTGAETVWPDEVERALTHHPKVRDVAVAGRPHPGWGQQVVAFVVPASIDAPPEVEEVRSFLADRLASFKAPRELILVPEIPRTASGKVQRSALHLP